MSDDSDPSDDALGFLQRRLRDAKVAGLHSAPLLQLEILLYIGREVHELRKLIEAIDRGRSEW